MNQRTDRITIIGAGLGGALLACYLAREGFDVAVYERLGDPRARGFVGGRSINLAISARGIAALREVSLADHVLKRAIPMPGRMIHDIDGDLHFQAYSKDPADHINSVSRSELNLVLLNAAAAHPNVRLVFDHRCSAIDFKPDRPSIIFERPDGSRERVECDRIIGADGAFSAVRMHMMLHMDRFEYSQHYLEHGYKELHIPPRPRALSGRDDQRVPAVSALTPALSQSESEWAMRPNALHIWPRGGYMMIALPNLDGSFTCTCFWPFSGPNGFDRLKTDEDIRTYFHERFPDAVPLMPTLVEDFRRNPTSSLVTVRCQPWHLRDKAVLMGDAAHAIVPFYGQGANAAFEDCPALLQCIRAHRGDWEAAFRAFGEIRKPHADAIADMAIENFIEMRDRTASPIFRGRKKLEHALHALFPGWFRPLYNMISFSTIPYAEARARARYQTRVIAALAGLIALILLGCLIGSVLAMT